MLTRSQQVCMEGKDWQCTAQPMLESTLITAIVVADVPIIIPSNIVNVMIIVAVVIVVAVQLYFMRLPWELQVYCL